MIYDDTPVVSQKEDDRGFSRVGPKTWVSGRMRGRTLPTSCLPDSLTLSGDGRGLTDRSRSRGREVKDGRFTGPITG